MQILGSCWYVAVKETESRYSACTKGNGNAQKECFDLLRMDESLCITQFIIEDEMCHHKIASGRNTTLLIDQKRFI